MRRRGHRVTGWAAAGVSIGLAVTLLTPLTAAADPLPTIPPKPNPPVCGLWGCSDTAPVVPGVPATGKPLPVAPPGGWTKENPPPKSEPLWWADFDSDGVVNWADNCVLVPNKDQKPAVKPADGRVPVNASAHAQAIEYKQQHPGAMYRTADELGEACSSYNENWRYTSTAFRVSSNERKRDIFRFLGEGGPMWGADTLALVVPTCARLDSVIGMLELIFTLPEHSVSNAVERILGPGITDHFSCSTGFLTRLGEELGQLIWAGKHLYHPTNAGGAITNRFFPIPTEVGFLNPVVKWFPWLFPGGTGQTVQGQVRRDGGRSTIDGRDVISLDWRHATGAGIGLEGNRWPITDQSLTDLMNALVGLGKVAGPGIEGQIIRALPIAVGDLVKMTPIKALDVNYLIYDACRALQEGFTPCTVQVAGHRKAGNLAGLRPVPAVSRTFDIGWMPFTTPDPDIIHQTMWEAKNLNAMVPSYYNLPNNNGFDN